jgi:hypothetical protein
MTWFLKSKIQKQKKIIQSLDKKLQQAALKYNELVAEYNGQNSFVPISFGQENESAKPAKEPEVVEL